MAGIDTFEPPLTVRLSRDLDAVFAEVVADFEAAVYTTALRVSGRADQADDLAAETFLRAYAALRRYSPGRIEELELRPWLLTICLNLWRNRLRAASRRPIEARWESPALDEGLPSPAPSPEDRAERQEQSESLAVALARLPEKQRVAIVLRYVVGVPHAEVAAVLGCPESTARSHVRRGLDQLRTLLTDDLEVLL